MQVHYFVLAGAERPTIILVHGDCLHRSDLTLEFRLSPDIGRPLDPVRRVSEHLMGEWRVASLMKPKVSRPCAHQECICEYALQHVCDLPSEQTLQDSLAMRLPAEVTAVEGCCRAADLCLEFWRGWVFLGTYKLPLAKIRRALAGQVRRLSGWR